MSEFALDWLNLREPVDHAVRDKTACKSAIDHLKQGKANILDLGAGSGSTLRFLAPRIPIKQVWLLVDHDSALLSQVISPDPIRVDVTIQTINLESQLKQIIEHTFPNNKLAMLVTISAFLDLVSEHWIDELTGLLVDRKMAVYSALTYDGRLSFEPQHTLDQMVRETLNVDQKRDKGFGIALGPDAHEAFSNQLGNSGYSIIEGTSDWDLGEDQTDLANLFVNGLFELAEKKHPDQKVALADWRDSHLSAIGLGQSRIIVGHKDLFARPVG